MRVGMRVCIRERLVSILGKEGWSESEKSETERRCMAQCDGGTLVVFECEGGT